MVRGEVPGGSSVVRAELIPVDKVPGGEVYGLVTGPMVAGRR